MRTTAERKAFNLLPITGCLPSGRHGNTFILLKDRTQCNLCWRRTIIVIIDFMWSCDGSVTAAFLGWFSYMIFLILRNCLWLCDSTLVLPEALPIFSCWVVRYVWCMMLSSVFIKVWSIQKSIRLTTVISKTEIPGTLFKKITNSLAKRVLVFQTQRYRDTLSRNRTVLTLYYNVVYCGKILQNLCIQNFRGPLI